MLAAIVLLCHSSLVDCVMGWTCQKWASDALSPAWPLAPMTQLHSQLDASASLAYVGSWAALRSQPIRTCSYALFCLGCSDGSCWWRCFEDRDREPNCGLSMGA